MNDLFQENLIEKIHKRTNKNYFNKIQYYYMINIINKNMMKHFIL